MQTAWDFQAKVDSFCEFVEKQVIEQSMLLGHIIKINNVPSHLK